jgi:hypothetical protein
MNLPIAPVIAGLLGGVVALGALAVPMPMLEALVMDSGLPAVLAAAEPPLGFTARAAVALVAGGGVGLFSWFALFVLLGSRAVTIGDAEAIDLDAVPTPVLRRADAHPDAPPRPPLLATRDLGRPFLDIRGTPEIDTPEVEVAEAEPALSEPEPPVEQPLPRDLDQPLSAFDPEAVPDVPMPPTVALPPLQRAPKPVVFDETERFEVFELTPPVPSAPVPGPRPVPSTPREEAIARPETEASVHALLERLERGVIRKAQATTPTSRPDRRARERSLEDALVTLRNMARRA